MDTAAMLYPQCELCGELERRIARRMAQQTECDARFGADRVRLTSYMENIGWPELFGYDMNTFLADADFALAQHLRQVIFWMDNVPDDTLPATTVQADVGMYWDMTLFGQQIAHTPQGVPEFLPHPLQDNGNGCTLEHFSFTETGDMPRLLAKHRRMEEIARDTYDGKLGISFPSFHRGPLDIYAQLRGYEAFLDDVAERPEQLQEMLVYLADERLRFARERQRFLHEPSLPPTSFVADDWVNIPFISPEIFRTFVMPVYARIEAHEGPVTGFHTCGRFEEIAADLLTVFPAIREIDVSGWNNLRELDQCIDPRIAFNVQIINTVSLCDDEPTQRAVMETIREVAQHRRVSVCAQAIVRLYPTYEETLARLNRFIARAYHWLS